MALFAPDLVLVLNYPGLPECAATAMRAALRPGVPMFGWLCDQLDEFPARFEPILDGVYYFDSACLPVLEDSYAGTHARLEFLPLAACPQRYACPSLDLRSRIPRLAFAGNCTPSRQAFFSEYRRLGQALDLFGPHAGNWPRVWRNCKLPPAALAQVYRGYLINLNLLQPGNTTHGLNLRAFEIPSAGGLATYPEVRDLARCFTPNQEILVYTSASDLAAIVGNILQQPDQALAITRAGHSRVMREHTFYHRATRMLGDWIGSSFKPNIPDYIASSA